LKIRLPNQKGKCFLSAYAASTYSHRSAGHRHIEGDARSLAQSLRVRERAPMNFRRARFNERELRCLCANEKSCRVDGEKFFYEAQNFFLFSRSKKMNARQCNRAKISTSIDSFSSCASSGYRESSASNKKNF
jgi:hypothetical protein